MEKGSDYYDGIYKVSKKYRGGYEGSHYLSMWTKTTEWIDAKSSIIDIGCGTGQYALFLFHNVSGMKYYGCDFSAEAIEQALRRGLPATYTFGKIDINSQILDFFPFSVVIMLEFLEHVKNDIDFLSKIPTGKHIIFSVPNFNSLGHVRYFGSMLDVKRRYCKSVEVVNECSYVINLSNHKLFLVNCYKK